MTSKYPFAPLKARQRIEKRKRINAKWRKYVRALRKSRASVAVSKTSKIPIASKHASSKHSAVTVSEPISITTTTIAPGVTETIIIAPTKHSTAKHSRSKHG